MCELCDCDVQSLLSTRFTDYDLESVPSDRSTDSYNLDDFRREPEPEHWKPDAVWTAAFAAVRFIAKCRVHRTEAPGLDAPTAHPEQTWIVFDWDDTLMPTSFLDDLDRMLPQKRQGSKQVGLPRDCPCFAAMERHADRVRSLLRTARSLGNVAIVTMAERGWVPESASQYLPGMDLEVLLSELEIPILYGPEFMEEDASLPEGEGDVYVASKYAAMLDFLKQGADSPCNLISIGDSTIEKHAAQQLSQTLGTKNPQSLCKTVKLMTDPSLKELSTELEIVQMCLERLAKHFQPVDVDAETVEELKSTVQKLLAV